MIEETAARRILFLRALDTTDKNGTLINETLWARARRAASSGDADARLDEMTREISEDLLRREGLDLTPFWTESRWQHMGTVLPLCFLLGLGADYLGPPGKVNLLFNPFLLLLAWNLVTYLALLFRALFFKTSKKLLFQGLLFRLSEWLLRLPLSPLRLDTPAARVLTSTRLRFIEDWHQAYPKLVHHRFLYRMHSAAACFALGVVGGFYLRGLVQAYSFDWASTFIRDVETLRALLGTIFGPVLLVGGALFPEGLPKLGDDANWIHLFALACLVYILVPRFILALWQHKQANHQLRKLTIDEHQAFFLKLLGPLRGAGKKLVVYAYSYTLSELQKQRLLGLARGIWGGKLTKSDFQRLEWGETEVSLPGDDSGVFVLVFNGVQTPEAEVHGEIANHMREETTRLGVPLAVVVNGEGLDAETRLHRCDTWNHELGQTLAWLDLSGEVDGASLEIVAAGLRSKSV